VAWWVQAVPIRRGVLDTAVPVRGVLTDFIWARVVMALPETKVVLKPVRFLLPSLT
jgi:hypothetical protein